MHPSGASDITFEAAPGPTQFTLRACLKRCCVFGCFSCECVLYGVDIWHVYGVKLWCVQQF
eukprot:14751351-Alexandrium_andersonii.AAC.1